MNKKREKRIVTIWTSHTDEFTNLAVQKLEKNETNMCPAIESSRIYYCICKLMKLAMLVAVKPRNTKQWGFSKTLICKTKHKRISSKKSMNIRQ